MSMVVRCQAVHKSFFQGPEEIHALRDIHLQVRSGDFICLSGPSGSGKTTLLNMIGGLDRPSDGLIEIAGQRIDQLDKGARAQLRLRQIGFVFQAYNLIPVLSACENVEMVMQLQGVSAQERRQRALALLDEVGLGGMAERRPAELSGGQQQRVAVARAIVSRPTIVLADEPTANLDSQTAAHLLQLMRQMNRDHHTTFILATHDPQVMQQAKRVVRLRDGVLDGIEDQHGGP